MADSDIVRLTQGQIKIIGDKIKEAGGGGGITELTSADYNYPTTGTKTSIALWLLNPGIYKLKGALSYRVTSSSSFSGYADKELIVLVSNYGGNTNKLILYPDLHRYNLEIVTSSGSTSTYSFGSGSNASTVLVGATVRNNLTSTDTAFPLSANQGKILNDKIGGDLSNLTTTDKTSLIAAINELVTRVAALEGN